MQAGIALSTATRGFDILYTYGIPGSLLATVQLGSVVKVPFGRQSRAVEGIVLEIHDDQNDFNFQIKDIISVVETVPIQEIQLELVKWMKEKYICTYFEAARCMTPTYAIEGSKTVKIASLAKSSAEVEKEIENLTINKLQHVNVLELLLDFQEMPVSLLQSTASVGPSVINTLAKYGYITIRTEKYQSVIRAQKGIEGQSEQPFLANAEQRVALQEIGPLIQNREFKEFLLHGITGSGKTEVYLQLIDQVIQSGRSAIVLVPEISLTPLMIGRFDARFPEMTAVLHSRMTAVEKRNSWTRISTGQAKVVVGARSAVFAPMKNIGIIVVDEEHETTYKSEIKPRYHAIDVARFLCQRHQAVLLLGSATPSVDTYYRALHGDVNLITMKQRTNTNGLPDITIIDMRNELEDGNRSVFSRLLHTEIKENIKNKMQTMLFLNRRGHSSFVICRDCGFVVKCRDCSVTMTYHKKTNKLICHYCGRLEKNPTVCPVCKSNKIKFFGTGTQKIEEELKKEFGPVTIVRMDMDTTTGRGSHQEILTRFEQDEIDVMIGTQMITKGHDFEKVTLVGVLAADSSLYSPDYRASERTFQQITQVSGRAGRGKHKGKVMIQAYNCDHPTILAAAEHNYERFYNGEILMRKTLGYPPFSNIGCIIVHGVNELTTKEAAIEVVNEINLTIKNARISDSEVIGPAPSPSARLRGRNRIRIIIKMTDMRALTAILTVASDSFYSKKHKEIDLSVDINPYNMV
ncbi:MAG: primosomal protein N' [Clostridia bacterium]